MPTAWPPAGMATFPQIRASGFDGLIEALNGLGWTNRAPTGAEQTANFAAARCDQGHQVIGRMLVAPNAGGTWPVATCNTEHRAGVLNSRAFLMPYPPFYWNFYGG